MSKVNLVPKKIIIETRETKLVDRGMCNGKGTLGEGVIKRRCPKGDGAGKLRI